MASQVDSQDGSVDGWIDKWVLPLNWATQMVAESFQNKGEEVPANHKELIGATASYQSKLLTIVTHFENRLPRILTQAGQIAVWAYIIFGVIAGQQTTTRFQSPGSHLGYCAFHF